MPWDGQDSVAFVCKFAKDASTPRSTYFADMEAHEVAQLYAASFSAALPAKYPRISYVAAFVLEFVDKPGRPVCGCEQSLDGRFKKYNNNVGAVCALSAEDAADLRARVQSGALPPGFEHWEPQSTAQAFSHFSFEHSQGNVLICDIQGVENRFTDPQIHTMSGKGFGLGNLGQTGIRAFLLRHSCTDLCRAVGLAPIHAKDLNERAGAGAGLPGLASSTAAIAAAAAAAAPSAALSHRSLGASASSAHIGMQQQQQQQQARYAQQQQHAAASARAQAASAAPSGGGGASLDRRSSAVPSASSSLRSSPAASPSSSPRNSVSGASVSVSATPLQLQRSMSGLQTQPQPPPPPPEPVGLDDSDEALMASIMGD